MKICAVCGWEKANADFWRDARSKDGLQPTCKSCHRELKDAREKRSGKPVKARQEQLL